ncbi:MAG: hypothetical protein KF764_26405 [Labilithrix sp.]|nr:hypothetical protein [Labilithrix sp.]MBX3221627.1 hypothetical protein [Labilithrix sp.]
MRFLRAGLVFAMVSGVFGGFGCAAAPEPVNVQKKYDAVTIFRAVYFDEGPATSVVKAWRLPRKDAVVARAKKPQPGVAAEQLRDLARQYDAAKLKATASNLRQLADTIEETGAAPRALSKKQRTAATKLVIARIRAADGTFFARFGKSVRSGSHVRVEKVLKEGLARITQAASQLPKNGTARELGGDYDDFSGYNDSGSYDNDTSGGGYEDNNSNNGGGYDDNNGGYDNDNGGYDNSGGANNNGGYDNDNNGGANDNGGYDNDNNGGANGNGDGTDNSNGGTKDNDGANDNGSVGNDNSKDGPVGDQAALQVNVTVYWDTAVVVDKVVGAWATIAFGASDDGSVQTASFVNHITTSFE